MLPVLQKSLIDLDSYESFKVFDRIKAVFSVDIVAVPVCKFVTIHCDNEIEITILKQILGPSVRHRIQEG